MGVLQRMMSTTNEYYEGKAKRVVRDDAFWNLWSSGGYNGM